MKVSHTICAIFLATFAAPPAFATPETTTVKCKSANYVVEVADIEAYPFANYGVNGWMNDAADVEMEESYLSERVLAFSLKIDGQPKKMEVAVTRTSANKKTGVVTYKGKIFSGAKSAQDAVCTRQ